MRRVKRRIFAGNVCEQEIFLTADETTPLKKLAGREPRLRFKNDDERRAHREGMARRQHIRAFNANFAPTSLYSTLTFDDAHEVHTFEDAKRIRTNYIRRLMRRYPDAVIFAYLGRGKSTSRIHMHMVSEGIPAEVIKQLWGMGDIERIVNLRDNCKDSNKQDIGRDYSGLANYLFDHWTQEQGGHRYYKTRTAKAYDKEDESECKRCYTADKPPRAPKAPEGYVYVLIDVMTTQYGYMNFRYSMFREDDVPFWAMDCGEPWDEPLVDFESYI